MNEPTIEELLLIMSDKEFDKSSAEEAFVQLYRAYSKFLNSAVINHLRSKGVYKKDFVDDIVSNVFLEVYDNPLNFSFDGKNHKSEETAFKAWICTIARNEFADIMKSFISHSTLNVLTINGELTDYAIETDFEEQHLSDNRKLIDKALEGLSDKERHILLACYDFYEEGKNTPSTVLDGLCEYWGTTRPNVRQIKKRALDKVKSYLNNSITVKK